MHIWAVAGGKGGTGKSLVSNGLGTRLAERGQKVILVDTDYGGPNQHTYCGLRKPATSLAQFFEERLSLEAIAQPTQVAGLRLIPGNVNSHNTDNLTTTQKRKLFRHLQRLEADHVILDLGAGTGYDTLDTFLQADVQVGVIAPDALAIENFYLFLKNLKYRQLGNTLSALGMRDRAKDIWKHRAEHGVVTTKQFVAYLRSLSPEFSERFDQEQRKLRMHVVLNQVREPRQAEIGLAVKSTVGKFFNIAAAYAGHVRYDKDLWLRFGQDGPALHHGSTFTLQQDLERITEGILAARFPEV
ncbi:MAG TPA: AAA family ATPase [Holophaga sp.]|nr:AAA family ATPase [Holophaga sp.]